MIKNGMRFKVGNKDVYGLVDGFNNIKNVSVVYFDKKGFRRYDVYTSTIIANLESGFYKEVDSIPYFDE